MELLLEYDPWLEFIGVIDHLDHLRQGKGGGADASDAELRSDAGIDSGSFHRSAHGAPSAGMRCQSSDVAIDGGNYVEYQTAPSMAWHGSAWCEAAVRRLLQTQFETYLGGLPITAENAAELSAAMTSGLRIWANDPIALPLPMGDTHVCRVWFASDGGERSAQLLQTGPRATRLRRLANGEDTASEEEEEGEEEGEDDDELEKEEEEVVDDE